GHKGNKRQRLTGEDGVGVVAIYSQISGRIKLGSGHGEIADLINLRFLNLHGNPGVCGLVEATKIAWVNAVEQQWIDGNQVGGAGKNAASGVCPSVTDRLVGGGVAGDVERPTGPGQRELDVERRRKVIYAVRPIQIIKFPTAQLVNIGAGVLVKQSARARPT